MSQSSETHPNHEQVLNDLDYSRRLHFARQLSQYLIPTALVNLVLALAAWGFFPSFSQFLVYAAALGPIVGLALLCEPLIRRNRLELWSMVTAIYLALVGTTLSIAIPEILLGAILVTPVIFTALGSMLGGRNMGPIGAIIGLGTISSIVVRVNGWSLGFPPLPGAISAVATMAIGAFGVVVAGVYYQGFLREQDRLFRGSQRAQLESEAARAEADEANRAKSTFLATMSHEIRTPMNGVIGMTTLLLDTRLNPTQKDYVLTIRHSGEALLAIINDILDFSKIESGTVELENRPFPLREALEEAISLLGSKTTEKNLELTCVVEPEVPAAIFSDEGRIRQIVLNLVGNSVKFTEAGEIVVTVSVESQGPDGEITLLFTVADSGIGIPPDRLGLLFQSFRQADSSISRRFGGTGLGLAICQRLTELLGGRIGVESTGVPGEGSTFFFTVKTRAAEPPSRRFLSHPTADLKGKVALLVDDSLPSLRVLQMQFQSWGFLTSTFSNPVAALAALKGGEKFDLAVVDYLMPGMNGVELCQEIRRLYPPEVLPTILISATTRENMVAGSHDFPWLLKPIRSSQLYDLVVDQLSPSGHHGIRPEATSEVAFDASMAERLPLRILLAEDHPTNQKLALLTLERMGYRADVAANGLEVLEALDRQPYDLVIMDIQMPEMDGLEATRQIRKRRPQEDSLRIVAMTANATKEDYEACLAAGMNDFIAKPIRLKELVDALNKCAPNRPLPPPDAPPSGPAVIEPAALEKLKDLVGGNRDNLARLVHSFLTEAPQLLLDIEKGQQEGDLVLLRRGAHTLKATARDFGTMPLAKLSEQLEALTKQEGADTSHLASQIRPAFEEAAAWLRKYLEGGADVL